MPAQTNRADYVPEDAAKHESFEAKKLTDLVGK